ncbi:hypothetical protein M427DRAFT_68790, partial [Gonapodya prolifera JEL478]
MRGQFCLTTLPLVPMLSPSALTVEQGTESTRTGNSRTGSSSSSLGLRPLSRSQHSHVAFAPGELPVVSQQLGGGTDIHHGQRIARDTGGAILLPTSNEMTATSETFENPPNNDLPAHTALDIQRALTSKELRQIERDYRALQEVLGVPVTGLGYGYDAIPVEDEDENVLELETSAAATKPTPPPIPTLMSFSRMKSSAGSSAQQRSLNYPDSAIIAGWTPPQKSGK